jgi:hypothetical protein
LERVDSKIRRVQRIRKRSQHHAVKGVFAPMHEYHEGNEREAVEPKKRFLGLKERLKSLVNPEVIVKKWSNCLPTPLK